MFCLLKCVFVTFLFITNSFKIAIFVFKGILPSHGRMAKFDTVEEKNAAVLTAADGFDNEDETEGMLAVGYY